jgi:hypothetical protein
MLDFIIQLLSCNVMNMFWSYNVFLNAFKATRNINITNFVNHVMPLSTPLHNWHNKKIGKTKNICNIIHKIKNSLDYVIAIDSCTSSRMFFRSLTNLAWDVLLLCVSCFTNSSSHNICKNILVKKVCIFLLPLKSTIGLSCFGPYWVKEHSSQKNWFFWKKVQVKKRQVWNIFKLLINYFISFSSTPIFFIFYFGKTCPKVFCSCWSYIPKELY